MAMETIRDFSGKIIAKCDHQSNGDIIVYDFYGKKLGKYDARRNVTETWQGKILYRGDAHGMLIPK